MFGGRDPLSGGGTLKGTHSEENVWCGERECMELGGDMSECRL
jgi:hypothetical protein